MFQVILVHVSTQVDSLVVKQNSQVVLTFAIKLLHRVSQIPEVTLLQELSRIIRLAVQMAVVLTLPLGLVVLLKRAEVLSLILLHHDQEEVAKALALHDLAEAVLPGEDHLGVQDAVVNKIYLRI